jgi:hypothetical protein
MRSEGLGNRTEFKIVVHGKDGPPQMRGPFQERLILGSLIVILCCRQDIISTPQAGGDRGWNVMIHVELDGHGSNPIDLSFRRMGDGPWLPRSAWIFLARSSMSRSMSG